MHIDIVAFQESDRKELSELHDLVRETTFSWLDEAVIHQSSFDSSTKGEIILVAKSNDRCVGFISAWKPDNFIHHLYVHPHHQRQGIGKLLLRSIISELDIPITLKCLKENTAAIRFYTGLGWSILSEDTSDEGDYFLFTLNMKII